MVEPLFMTPVFHHKIWGGSKLQSQFGFKIPDDQTGEAWIISGHSHGPTAVANGRFKGQTLAELWQTHKELFNNEAGAVFPLLIKILDAKTDLSIQVHPDDAYAAEHEHELGKTECWYILQADPGAKLYYGHQATTRDELKTMIEAQDWSHLLRQIPVKAGEFYYVPSGTIHALGQGILALETQQSSDSTYRVYDFDRLDKKTGQKRALHLKQAIDVTRVPHVDPVLDIATTSEPGLTKTHLLSSPYFDVEKWRCTGSTTQRRQADYQLFTVIDGNGTLTVDGHDYPLEKGASFVIPYDVDQLALTGSMVLITSWPNQTQAK
ncbi:mannose-6-phosphate isomerase, class I [Secundilactobacillus kimchicus]|uniref:mannose-6-phosphate isomerase, class I n=1 Tax=Secundilactobacillus kimchicus TaxID=528209 RepID=UPI0006E1B030|nr:mannose-6-phosphate isomerase, class I [Secundilactobacillus kimchicus]MBT9670826.1 mannose-6-phosphate isomerase, class I [Secundilactobacillus kimchicus]